MNNFKAISFIYQSAIKLFLTKQAEAIAMRCFREPRIRNILEAYFYRVK